MSMHIDWKYLNYNLPEDVYQLHLYQESDYGNKYGVSRIYEHQAAEAYASICRK